MADIFLKADVHNMLAHKTVYFVGDSNMRGFYKDFVQLIKENGLMDEILLKTKMEDSFHGDTKVYGTKMSNNRNATEKRRFFDGNITAYYYFVTKCYNNRTEIILRDMIANPPDIVIYNSCLWDIIRWGPNGPNQFKQDLNRLMDRFKAVLPEHAIVMWFTTPPISSNIRSSFFIKQVEFMKNSMRFEIMEANIYASHTAMKHGYDCVDVHYHLRWQIHRRTDDGTHWLPHAVRYVTNLWLTHVALALDFNLPGRIVTKLLTDAIDMENENYLDDSTPTHGDPDGVAEDLSAAATENVVQQPTKRRGALRGRRLLRGSRSRVNTNRPRNDRYRPPSTSANSEMLQPNFRMRPNINFAEGQLPIRFQAVLRHDSRQKGQQRRKENVNNGNPFNVCSERPSNEPGSVFQPIRQENPNAGNPLCFFSGRPEYGVAFDEPCEQITILPGQFEENPYESNYPGFEYCPPQEIWDHGRPGLAEDCWGGLDLNQANGVGMGNRGNLNEQVFDHVHSSGGWVQLTFPLP